MHVTFVIFLDKNGYLFRIVILVPLLHLIWCMLTYRVLFLSSNSWSSLFFNSCRWSHTFHLGFYVKNKGCGTTKLTIIFIKLINTQFQKTTKVIRSDNGPEFTLKSFYQSHGIIHQTLHIKTPKQNGVIKCKRQHLLIATHALMFQSSMLLIFWSHTFTHAAHLINHLPSSLLHNNSPYATLYNTPLDYTFLHTLRCLLFL